MVEMPRDLVVVFQKKSFSPVILVAPFQNVTCPDEPVPVIVPPPEPAQFPFGSSKQPDESLNPLFAVDVAPDEIKSEPVVIERPAVEESPAVEIPPAKVEVAVEVEMIVPVVNRPTELEEKNESTTRPIEAKKEVVVAFVVVELSAMKVVEAKRPDCVQIAVVVAETAVPKFVEGVNEYCPAPVWSVPQTMLPEPSVSRASVQVRTVASLMPPPLTLSPPAIVEVAAVL